MNWREHPWAGVLPATLCPFDEDQSLDEQGLRDYIAELAAVEGVKGLTCNGHTGEIMAPRPEERARVTQICAETARRSGRGVKVISGVWGGRFAGGDRSRPGGQTGGRGTVPRAAQDRTQRSLLTRGGAPPTDRREETQESPRRPASNGPNRPPRSSAAAACRW